MTSTSTVEPSARDVAPTVMRAGSGRSPMNSRYLQALSQRRLW